MLFLGKLNIVSESWINNALKDLTNTFNDIFTVLTCVDDPANSFLELVSSPFWFIKATLTVNVEHFLDYSEDFKKQISFWKIACSTNRTFDSMEKNKCWVVYLQFWYFVIFKVFKQGLRKSFFFTFDIWSQISFERVWDSASKFRKSLQIIFIFLLSFDEFAVFFSHQIGNFIFKFYW